MQAAPSTDSAEGSGKHGRSAAFRIITRSLTADFFGAQRRASVPLDFGRRYVHLQGRFNCDAWCTALTVDCGIVTTKPMMLPVLRWRDVNGGLPGIALTKHSHPLRIAIGGAVLHEGHS